MQNHGKACGATLELDAGLAGRELLLEEVARVLLLSLLVSLRMPSLWLHAWLGSRRVSRRMWVGGVLSLCEVVLLGAIFELAVRGSTPVVTLAQAWFILLGAWLGVAFWNGSLLRDSRLCRCRCEAHVHHQRAWRYR